MSGKYLLLAIIVFTGSLTVNAQNSSQLKTGTFCEVYQTISDNAKNNFADIKGSFTKNDKLFTHYESGLKITNAVSSRVSVIQNTTFFFVTLGEYQSKKEAASEMGKMIKDIKKCLPKNIVVKKVIEEDGSTSWSLTDTINSKNEKPGMIIIQNTALDTKWRIVFALQGIK